MVYFHITLTVILWASAFVGIRAGLSGFRPFELALFRYIVASVIMGLIALINGIRIPDKKDFPQIALTGFIGITFYNMALNYGEQTITAGEACFLINTAPLFTALLARAFLGEVITPRFIIGLLFSFAGVSLMVLRFDGEISFRFGSLIILMAAMAHASFFVIQRPLLKKYKPIEVVTYAIWSGTLFMLPFGWRFCYRLHTAGYHATAAVVYLGVFPAALAYFCWSSVLSRFEASKAASFLYSVPVVTLVIGFIWLREVPSPLSIAGGIIAIGGVALANIKRMAHGANEKSVEKDRIHLPPGEISETTSGRPS